MNNETMVIGLPIGSLADPKRGGIPDLLKSAGILVSGYTADTKEGSSMRMLSDIDGPPVKLIAVRPQNVPRELANGQVDLTITGADWVSEWGYTSIECLLDLRKGVARLVTAVPKDFSYSDLGRMISAYAAEGNVLTVATEYPNIMRRAFMENPSYKGAYGNAAPRIIRPGEISGTNEMVSIRASYGATETLIQEGGAQFIMDLTQTGEGLRRAGLKEWETIMETSAGLYAGPSCTGQKREIADLIRTLLLGAMTAEGSVMVTANIPGENLSNVIDFLKRNRYCADAPTLMECRGNGDTYYAVQVVIPERGYMALVAGLMPFGADAILKTAVDSDVRQNPQGLYIPGGE